MGKGNNILCFALNHCDAPLISSFDTDIILSSRRLRLSKCSTILITESRNILPSELKDNQSERIAGDKNVYSPYPTEW